MSDALVWINGEGPYVERPCFEFDEHGSVIISTELVHLHCSAYDDPWAVNYYR